MESLWGRIDLRSEIIPFTFSRYYQRDMGKNLLRQFVSFTDLIDPEHLAEIKHQSNALEARLADELDHDGIARPVNLDPGYVDAAKLGAGHHQGLFASSVHRPGDVRRGNPAVHTGPLVSLALYISRLRLGQLRRVSLDRA